MPRLRRWNAEQKSGSYVIWMVILVFANQVDRGHQDSFKFLEREGMGPSFAFAGTFM